MSDVTVRLTAEEALHTAAYLKASTCEMLPELGKAWKLTPVGRAQAKIEAAATAEPRPRRTKSECAALLDHIRSRKQ